MEGRKNLRSSPNGAGGVSGVSMLKTLEIWITRSPKADKITIARATCGEEASQKE